MTARCSVWKTVVSGTDSGKAEIVLIVTPGGSVSSDQYQGGMLRSEKNGTPFEAIQEEIVFEKLLTPSPNRWRNEPMTFSSECDPATAACRGPLITSRRWRKSR